MNTRIIVAGGTVAGLAVGAVSGYFLAKKRYEQAFVEALKTAVDEEVKAVEDYYRILTKRGAEYASPEVVLANRVAQRPVNADGTPVDDSVVEEPHTVEEIEGMLKKIRKWDPDKVDAEDPPAFNETLKYWQGDDSRIIGQPSGKAMIPERRDSKKPYQITEETFFQGDEENEQISLVWFSGDEVLAGVEDDVPYESNACLGRELKLEEFADGDGEEQILYFRNPSTNTDFEVNLSELSYGEYVVGIEPKG